MYKIDETGLIELLINVYIAGFKRSGEGFNGEYPYEGSPEQNIKQVLFEDGTPDIIINTYSEILKKVK
jgi:hypothetical protein